MQRKGIILAGGSGTRLWPITMGVSKQLLPIFDKPMIYYPLCVLMSANIKEILIITTPDEQAQYRRLLGDGSQWGINLTYIVQPSPDGLAQAYILAEDFLDGSSSALVLGDNIFYGHGLANILENASQTSSGGTVFGYHVSDPERYGVAEFDLNGQVTRISEKPIKAKSRYAITGLYFYDNSAIEKAKTLKPSTRGEYEITDINNMYLSEGNLKVELMSRGMAWLDTGTYESLHEASGYIKTIEQRQGLQVGCPEEVAWRQGWITKNQILKQAAKLGQNGYTDYLIQLTNDK